ncbi:uncharacterized protein LDX57_002811, partial [Aspergillus melleus]|uniref:uncharacterized protein n=1 Tax=Aspergillus melleus TaxID=138277 RepID=UPI001E8DDDF7
LKDPMIGNSDTYLNAIQFIGSLRDPDGRAMPSTSLRHSACLSILRQEIWNAFLNRRPFRSPVSNDYEIADLANDFIWTNRVMVWVADLLIFCFGKYPLMGFEERMERWTILKSVEQRWDMSKPPAFKPIFYCDRDASSGKQFPDTWHMNACQVAGAQHVELGRILLATSDPRQSSAFGISAVSRAYGPAAELRSITRRLCGLAVSNGKCPAASVTAMVGISICGEYFTDLQEQQAIVRLLNELEYDHAWPTAGTVGDIYGNGTKCIKNLKYVVLGGTHTHLFDLVGRSEHSLKHKTLSAAFAIKNLERWEFEVAHTAGRLLHALNNHCADPLPAGQAIANPED